MLPPDVGYHNRDTCYIVQISRENTNKGRDYCSRGYGHTGGVYPTYKSAIEAIKETMDDPANSGPSSWTAYAIVVHKSDTATVGFSDAVRQFDEHGVAYIPPDVTTAETLAAAST